MEDNKLTRFKEHRDETQYRVYDEHARDGVAEFYYQNHIHQTVDFVKAKRAQWLPPSSKCEMSFWEAVNFLNTLVDDSDPDIDLSQLDHHLQTAEAMRQDGLPRWFVLAGFVHDMGKVLCLWDEPQYCVVGDTFPVGCRWSPKIVYSEFFRDNPDAKVPLYQTENGIYEPKCGLDNVLMSWGHDEYLSQVTRPYLPVEAQWVIRYHSFYSWHKEGEYKHLMNDTDVEKFQWVKKFNPYDLYSKKPVKPDWKKLQPYYQELVAEYFPEIIKW